MTENADGTRQASAAHSDPGEPAGRQVLRQRADRILAQLTGSDGAQFRDGQFEAIEALVSQRRRALVVQRTGWGKSAVYFVAARLLRQAGAGPTLIISPLLALMRDQISAATRAGVRAVTINSANAAEWDQAIGDVRAGRADVVLISPERLSNPSFRENVLGQLVSGIGMIVVDEAHCISDWGHDFRPDYRRIGSLLVTLDPGVPVLATTATANSRVVADVAEQLGDDTLVIRGPLTRDSLRLGVAPTADPQTRIAWLVRHLGDFTGSGIVYTLTVAAAQDTARALRDAGFDVASYTGATDPEEREQLEAALKDNRVKALIATSALGMGFDKPDLGFVIHLGAPSSAVAYYQQVGRAGRGTDSADVLLLPGPEDPEIWNHFATASMPDPDQAQTVLEVLGSAPQGQAVSIPQLEPLVGAKRTRLELLLKTMQVEGAVDRVKGGFVATGAPWQFDHERYRAVEEVRRREADAMLEYEKGTMCRMKFLAQQLDDSTAVDCGRCDVCAGVWWHQDTDAHSEQHVAQLLGGLGLEVEPRGVWPAHMGRIGVDLTGKIPPELRTEQGRVIARMTDMGPGQTLRAFLAEGALDEPVPAQIGQWCLTVLGEWGWKERPTTVVSVPSVTRPVSAQSLAQELARAGRLTYAGALDLLADPGSPDVNSAFRVKNLSRALNVSSELAHAVRDQVVLLVDTEIQSRWTMTMAGFLLRSAGARAVVPFALALRA